MNAQAAVNWLNEVLVGAADLASVKTAIQRKKGWIEFAPTICGDLFDFHIEGFTYALGGQVAYQRDGYATARWEVVELHYFAPLPED